jgi:hypothetical protein
MPNKSEGKDRKRMVVEEVGTNDAPKEEVKETEIKHEPEILTEAAKDTSPIEPETPATIAKPAVDSKIGVQKSSKSPSIALWIIIPGIFLLGAILGGIVFYQKGVNSGDEASPTPTATPISSPVPSSSPTATEDLTKYTISIFNGSGIAGEAGRAKTLLTTAGFKIGSTGNAASYDYTKTIIKAKSTVDAAFVSALSVSLGKTYVVDTAQTLATTSADTIQVVIGSSKAE